MTVFVIRRLLQALLVVFLMSVIVFYGVNSVGDPFYMLVSTDGDQADIAATPPDPLEAAAIRTLVVHQWRRLLLRHEDWPVEVLPEGWQGEVCRGLVHDTLRALDPAANTWMDAAFLST